MLIYRYFYLSYYEEQKKADRGVLHPLRKSAYRDFSTLGVAPLRCPYPQEALQI